MRPWPGARLVPGWGGAVTSADEDTLLDAGVPAAFQVNQLVADHVTARQVQPEFVARVPKKLRRGFAAAARRVRRFRGDIDFVEVRALAGKFLQQMLIH